MSDFSAVIPIIYAHGVKALRQNAVMPYLVNLEYKDEAAKKGSTILVDVPAAMSVYDVTPSHTEKEGESLTPANISVSMGNWKGASFAVSDKAQLELKDDYIANQSTEAVKALCNNVDLFCFTEMASEIYNVSGTPGTTPFADIGKVTAVGTVLNSTLCPIAERRMVCDSDAYGAAQDLEQLSSIDYVTDHTAMMDGQIGIRKGFSWHMDQNTPTHSKGTENGAYVLDGGESAGDTVIALKTGTGTILEGDIVTFAGHTQTYVVRVGVGAPGNITIAPGLKVDVAGDVAMTVAANHVLNMAFNRNCFMLVSRPLKGLGGPNIIMQQDPVTGLVLRLEIKRQNKQALIEWDILTGGRVIRPEFGCRVYG